MVQVITREWEITKTYIYEVVSKKRQRDLRWKAFELKAQDNKPVVAVKVDEPLPLYEIARTAFDEIKKNVKGRLSCMFFFVYYKKGRGVDWDDVGELNSHLYDIIRKEKGPEAFYVGAKESDTITNYLSIAIYAFEKI